MNIIEYAIRLGKSLNKTEEGEELKKIYNQVKESHNRCEKEVNKEYYSVYNQYVERECSRNHFFGWHVSYDKMKCFVENEDNKSDTQLFTASEYVVKKEEFSQLALASEAMGNLAVQITDAVIAGKYEDDKIRKILKVMKIKNAVTDLQMAVERSGLKLYLLKNANQLLNIAPQWEEYEKKLKRKNYVPYIGDETPPIILENEDKAYIDILERIMFVQHLILTGMFEGFWNILIELDENDKVKGEFYQGDKIKKYSFSHMNIGKELINQKAWVYKIYMGQNYIYVLANKRTLYLGNGEQKSEVFGLCYPKEDL